MPDAKKIFNNQSKEIIENPDSVKTNFEYEEKMRKIREEVASKLCDYRKTLDYMGADGPIEILCLPKVIENALIAHGLLRIYDLFDVDFTKIKGLGIRRIGELTSCLDKFFPVL